MRAVEFSACGILSTDTLGFIFCEGVVHGSKLVDSLPGCGMGAFV